MRGGRAYCAARASATAMSGLLAMALCGCASVHVSGGGDQTATGTVSRSSERRDMVALPGSDLEALRQALRQPASAGGTIAWSNPETGTYGTIGAVLPFRAENGAACQAFSTTVATYSGVLLYQAEACRGPSGEWDAIKVKPGGAAG